MQKIHIDIKYCHYRYIFYFAGPTLAPGPHPGMSLEILLAIQLSLSRFFAVIFFSRCSVHTLELWSIRILKTIKRDPCVAFVWF